MPPAQPLSSRGNPWCRASIPEARCSGVAEHRDQFVAQAGKPVQVLPDIDPLVERYLKRIVGINVCGKSIDAVFLLRLETSKPPVPNDQYSRMIAVNVLRIDRVVDAVVG